MGGRPGSGAQQNINFYKRDIQTGAETSCASGYNTLYITITVFFISCTDRNHGSYKTGTESGSSYVKAVPDLWNCISDLLRDIQSAVQTGKESGEEIIVPLLEQYCYQDKRGDRKDVYD